MKRIGMNMNTVIIKFKDKEYEAPEWISILTKLPALVLAKAGQGDEAASIQLILEIDSHVSEKDFPELKDLLNTLTFQEWTDISNAWGGAELKKA